MLKKIVIKFIVALILALPLSVLASPISFTLELHAEGTLGGVAFNAPIAISSEVDSEDFVPLESVFDNRLFISGLGEFDLAASNPTFWSVPPSVGSGNFVYLGILSRYVFYVQSDNFLSWDGTSSFSTAGNDISWFDFYDVFDNPVVFTVGGGEFVLSSVSPQFNFTAANIPLPSTLLLMIPMLFFAITKRQSRGRR